MKFGILIPQQYLAAEPMAQKIDDALEQVRLVRDLNFNLIAAGQHHLATPYRQAASIPFMARIAAESGDMRLAFTILQVGLHHPVDIAEQIMTLDAISHGRLIFGVGLGYREEEFTAFGIPKGQRVERMNEVLEVIKLLWTQDEVEYRGKFFTIPKIQSTIKTIQRPYPPIWMAANSDGAVKRAAQNGYAWVLNPHVTMDLLKRQIALYHEVLKENSHPIPDEMPMIREVWLAKSREEAWRQAAPYLGEKYQTYVPWGQDKVVPPEEHFSRPLHELAEDRFIIGTPDDLIAQCERFKRELGVTTLIMRVQWPGTPQHLVRENLKLIGKEVIPHCKQA